MKFDKETIESFTSPLEFALYWNVYLFSKQILENLDENISHNFAYKKVKDLTNYKLVNDVARFKSHYSKIPIDVKTYNKSKEVVVSVYCDETNQLLKKKISLEYLQGLSAEGVNLEMANDVMLDECHICKKTDVKLLKCGACGIVQYCSKECQKSDWKDHKVTCYGKKI